MARILKELYRLILHVRKKASKKMEKQTIKISFKENGNISHIETDIPNLQVVLEKEPYEGNFNGTLVETKKNGDEVYERFMK